ncbi:hypothetical protein O181_034771 [Austropuccinia psidii MF-1]|uniref:Uncharacterized protein n=1 Tax=Austropuccinia psidii MF-1 TaxID=1389203 RepID=A0A9Q3H8C6_9BASI|nr:hypothetical protein [Austropuccinia psidii MF-1]
MPKPLAGGHEVLFTNQELSGSVEDHIALRRVDPTVLQRQGQKSNDWLNNQILLSIDQKKELKMTPALEKEGPVVSTSSKTAPEISKDKPKGPQKNHKGPNNHQRKANWDRPYPKGYRIPKLEPSAMENVFNMARALMEITASKQERINRTFLPK